MSNSTFIQNRPCISKHFYSYCASLVALRFGFFVSDVRVLSIELNLNLSSPLLIICYSFRGERSEVLSINLSSDTFSPLDVNLVR